MRKLKASKFEVLPTAKVLMKIQEQAHKYKDEKDLKDANDLLTLYAQISFDEGYRENIKEVKKLMTLGTSVKAKNRRRGVFEYIDGDDIQKVLPLARKRIESKSLRKSKLKDWKEKGREWSEELFILSMVIHTFFEAGYLKAETLEEQTKIICGENADIVFNMVTEMFNSELSKEV